MTNEEQLELASKAISVFKGKIGALAAVVTYNGEHLTLKWCAPPQNDDRVVTANVLVQAAKMLMNEVNEPTTVH